MARLTKLQKKNKRKGDKAVAARASELAEQARTGLFFSIRGNPRDAPAEHGGNPRKYTKKEAKAKKAERSAVAQLKIKREAEELVESESAAMAAELEKLIARSASSKPGDEMPEVGL